jgi:hypothetical protein
VRLLRAFGYRSIERFHMNEGHSSLLTWSSWMNQRGKQAGQT